MAEEISGLVDDLGEISDVVIGQDGIPTIVAGMDDDDPRSAKNVTDDAATGEAGDKAADKKPEEKKKSWSLADEEDPEEVDDLEDDLETSPSGDKKEGEEDPHARNHAIALRRERSKNRELAKRLEALEQKIATPPVQPTAPAAGAPQGQQQPQQERLPTPDEIEQFLLQRDSALAEKAKALNDVRNNANSYQSVAEYLAAESTARDAYVKHLTYGTQQVLSSLQTQKQQAIQKQSAEQQAAQYSASQELATYERRIMDSQLPDALEAAKTLDAKAKYLHPGIGRAIIQMEDSPEIVHMLTHDREAWKYAIQKTKEYQGKPIPLSAITKLSVMAAKYAESIKSGASEEGKDAAQGKPAGKPEAQTTFRRPKAGGGTASGAASQETFDDPAAYARAVRNGEIPDRMGLKRRKW